MAEVMVVDLQGQTRTLSQRWATAFGLAWSPDGSEIWFTGGTYVKNVLAAVSLGAKGRDVFRGTVTIQLEDIAKDGTVLINNKLTRYELVYAGDSGGKQTTLSWTDLNFIAALSADGRVLFSTLQTVPTPEGLQPAWVMVRRVDGAPAQVLGEGLAVDWSADRRWALATSVDYRKLTALPIGVGHARSLETHDLFIITARWTPDGTDLLVTGRAPGEEHVRLYRLPRDGSRPALVSDAALSTLRSLQVSPDGRWGATVNEEQQVVVISLQDGAMRPVPGLGGGDAIPRGWSPQGHLWVTQGSGPVGAQARLLRLDPATGKVFEERNIGPADPGGGAFLRDVVLSPDGRQVAFSYVRDLGSLVVLRGLGRSPN
jgi:hypothetical protein